MYKFAINALFVFSLLICLGCSKYAQQNYKGWKLSDEFRTTHSEFRNFRTGHLLVTGNSSILSIDVKDKSIREMGKTDVSTCSHIRVEMPSLDNLTLPVTIKNPKSYLQICSCTWGNCKEESLREGWVEVTDVAADGMTAKVNLVFPSTAIKRSGFYLNQIPDWLLIYNDAEIPSDVKKSWGALRIQ